MGSTFILVAPDLRYCSSLNSLLCRVDSQHSVRRIIESSLFLKLSYYSSKCSHPLDSFLFYTHRVTPGLFANNEKRKFVTIIILPLACPFLGSHPRLLPPPPPTPATHRIVRGEQVKRFSLARLFVCPFVFEHRNSS